MAERGPQHYIDLADWRRRVGDLYRLKGPDALQRFRQGRDRLFRTHPQSPLSPAAQAAFKGLSYFEHDPSYRLTIRLEPAAAGEPLVVDTGGDDGVITYRRAGWLNFRLGRQDCRLTVFSLVGYGGGLFLPFRDGTSGKETYGGGRYLFDTVKNTDGLVLEMTAGSPDMTIDFNFAYNPSCAYDARWACPLAPRENWLPVPVRAGEKVFA
ncbi:MAG TPA: DUF1684 domain-containing protein [Candidatus Dormibacteraeota bacterium]|nr:DUF1684 domain-containing protein [Candidatus Dormibacteraeota bacterium]